MPDQAASATIDDAFDDLGLGVEYIRVVYDELTVQDEAVELPEQFKGEGLGRA